MQSRGAGQETALPQGATPTRVRLIGNDQINVLCPEPPLSGQHDLLGVARPRKDIRDGTQTHRAELFVVFQIGCQENGPTEPTAGLADSQANEPRVVFGIKNSQRGGVPHGQ